MRPYVSPMSRASPWSRNGESAPSIVAPELRGRSRESPRDEEDEGGEREVADERWDFDQDADRTRPQLVIWRDVAVDDARGPEDVVISDVVAIGGPQHVDEAVLIYRT